MSTAGGSSPLQGVLSGGNGKESSGATKSSLASSDSDFDDDWDSSSDDWDRDSAAKPKLMPGDIDDMSDDEAQGDLAPLHTKLKLTIDDLDDLSEDDEPSQVDKPVPKPIIKPLPLAKKGPTLITPDMIGSLGKVGSSPPRNRPLPKESPLPQSKTPVSRIDLSRATGTPTRLDFDIAIGAMNADEDDGGYEKKREEEKEYASGKLPMNGLNERLPQKLPSWPSVAPVRFSANAYAEDSRLGELLDKLEQSLTPSVEVAETMKELSVKASHDIQVLQNLERALKQRSDNLNSSQSQVQELNKKIEKLTAELKALENRTYPLVPIEQPSSRIRAVCEAILIIIVALVSVIVLLLAFARFGQFAQRHGQEF